MREKHLSFDPKRPNVIELNLATLITDKLDVNVINKRNIN